MFINHDFIYYKIGWNNFFLVTYIFAQTDYGLLDVCEFISMSKKRILYRKIDSLHSFKLLAISFGLYDYFSNILYLQ